MQNHSKNHSKNRSWNRYNISSLFLLLPLFFTPLNSMEIIMIGSVSFVSFLYHTNRERDKENGLELSQSTTTLYYIDRFQIQLGFTYILLKSFPLQFTLPLYFISLYLYKDHYILAFIVLCCMIKVGITNPVNLMVVFIGLFIAYFGYQGMPIQEGKYQITNWSELNKCMWHGGMGICVTGLFS